MNDDRTFDLLFIAQWLEAGCDPKHAAAELRIYAERLAAAALSAAPAQEPVGEPVAWLFEDTLPTEYPYDAMFAHSQVRGGVRMFPVFAPLPQEVSQAEAYLQEMREHGNADDATEAAAHLARVKVLTQQKCTTCGGSGVVDDGEIDCYSNGAPFENGPIKCVKDCPACGGVRGAQEAKAGEWQDWQDIPDALIAGILRFAWRREPTLSEITAAAKAARPSVLTTTLSASSKGEQR